MIPPKKGGRSFPPKTFRVIDIPPILINTPEKVARETAFLEAKIIGLTTKRQRGTPNMAAMSESALESQRIAALQKLVASLRNAVLSSKLKNRAPRRIP